ncbi:MAG: RNA polymerase sigma factor, partial [Terriglobia bacterium]
AQASSDPAEASVTALAIALQSLPHNYAKAIVLHDVIGLPVAQAAAELGAPEGTVRSWLSRGRALLAARLDGHE